MVLLSVLLAGAGGSAALAAGSTAFTDSPALAFGLPDARPAVAEPAPILVAQSQQEAQLVVRLQELEEQIRSLTGQVEGLQFQLTQLQTLLQNQQEDYEFRFQQLEGGAAGKPEAVPQSGGATPSGEAPQSQDQGEADIPATTAPVEEANAIPADPNAIPEEGIRPNPDEIVIDPTFEDDMPMDDIGPSHDPLVGTGQEEVPALGNGEPLSLTLDPNAPAGNPDADAQYAAGYEAIVRGDYPFAEDQFRQFLSLYPQDRQAADAANFLGEALIQRGAWDEAAETLLGAFQTYPASPRAPDLLLKLGIALNGAQERETACRMFSEVSKRFPNQPQAFQNRLAQEKINAQCPPA